MGRDQTREIETLVRARYPIIYVVSWEEHRVESALRGVAERRGKRFFIWTTTDGLVLDGHRPRADGTTEPLAALDEVMKSQDAAVFMFKDFHRFLRDDAQIVRKLRDLASHLKRSYKSVVLVSPVLELPTELEKEITVIDYALPTAAEIRAQVLQTVAKAREDERLRCDLSEEELDEIVRAAQGLTAVEVDNVLMKSFVECQRPDPGVILADKEQIIRKSGVLEYFHTDETIDDVGGLDALSVAHEAQEGVQRVGSGIRLAPAEGPAADWSAGLWEIVDGEGRGRSLATPVVASGCRPHLLRNRRFE